MTERVQVLEREVTADFVVDDDRTDRVGLEFAADHRRGNAAFLQIAEQVDVEKEPVGENDQRLDAAVEQHLQIALETAALVVHVGENGKIRRLVERVLDAAQHQRAVRIGHVKHHDADGVAAFAAQRAGKLVGTVSEFLGGTLDSLLGDSRDVARQRRVVQDDRHRGRGKSAFLRHVTNGHHRRPCAGTQGRRKEIPCTLSTFACRLNCKRTLADTTAESNTSVKRANHIEMFRFVSARCDGGRHRRGAGLVRARWKSRRGRFYPFFIRCRIH